MKKNKNRFLGILMMALIVEFLGTANAALFAQTAPRSWYVSANGNDENNGRSEEQAFKTLDKAVDAAKTGMVKRITVLGKIASPNREISQSGADEILITGKPDAAEGEKAEIISVRISQANIRFTYISLSEIRRSGSIERLGLTLRNSVITLGAGALVSGIASSYGNITMTDDAVIRGDISCTGPVQITMSDNATITGGKGIRGHYEWMTTITMSGNARIINNTGDNNDGGGAINAAPGIITMSDNAEISGNTTKNSGGGISGRKITLTMSGNARIVDNTSNEYGGGISVRGESIITISDNAKISGNTAKYSGGGVYAPVGGKITINGGEISGNTAKDGGGLFITGETSVTGVTITGNKAENGAGVFVGKGNNPFFTLKSGSITGNEAEFVGGGVYVENGATYTAEGGTVTDNTAGDGGNNVFRQQ